MPQFLKKSRTIEASQWFKPGDHPGVTCRTIGGETELPHVKTAGGPAQVFPGDYIVTESDGRGFYPVRPDIFEADNDPVSEQSL